MAAFAVETIFELERVNDIREDVTNSRANQRQNDDDDDGDKDEDQSIFDQTLAFFTRHVQHDKRSSNKGNHNRPIAITIHRIA